MALPATWNLQLARSIGIVRVRIPLSPPPTTDKSGFGASRIRIQAVPAAPRIQGRRGALVSPQLAPIKKSMFPQPAWLR